MTGWLRRLPLAYKMMLSAGALILISNFFGLFVAVRMTANSMRKKNLGQLQEQLAIILSTVTSSIDDTTNLMLDLTAASSIKTFANDDAEFHNHYLETVNGANDRLRQLLRSNAAIDYVAVIRIHDDQHLYVGENILNKELFSVYQENYKTAQNFVKQGILSNLLAGWHEIPMLNLYCTIYDKYSPVQKPVAFLMVGMNTKKMQYFIADNEAGSNIRLLNSEGDIIVSKNLQEIGKKAENYERFQGDSGELDEAENMIAYRKNSGQQWVADASIPKDMLFADVYRLIQAMFASILCFMIGTLVICSLLCRRIYRPIAELREAMGEISKGNYRVKVRTFEDPDLKQLSEGFSQMAGSIENALDLVRSKEQEKMEILLNALQSQIRPHFLYNTLECIHWQALLEKAPGTSKMVLTLSKYYSLCLSKGKDIISLGQELEHIKSYMALQNMRFDNIAAVNYHVSDSLYGLEIPKITLQPLVENALYHGIKAEAGRTGTVDITGDVSDGKLILTVSDDGVGMEEEAIAYLNRTINELVNDGSYGIKNVHKRLALRYGNGYGLHYEGNEDGGICVYVTLPARILQNSKGE